MPVTCGTRLERLEALARQVQVEIEAERRAQREGRVSGVEPQPLGRPIVPVAPRPSLGNAEIAAIMVDLGVTAADVRTWARAQGMNVPERGTLRGEIVAAYRDAFGTLITEGQASCVCGAQMVRPYPNDTGDHSTTECPASTDQDGPA